MHKRKSTRPTPLHTNSMESGPGNTFSAETQKKTKRFIILDPKEWGSFFDPSPFPRHLAQNLKKVGFKWGGGGPDQTVIGGCVYWAK